MGPDPADTQRPPASHRRMKPHMRVHKHYTHYNKKITKHSHYTLIKPSEVRVLPTAHGDKDIEDTGLSRIGEGDAK